MGNKLSSWKEKLLSSASKEILIKSVAQAIPTYTISCFKLPDALCDELAGMVLGDFGEGSRKTIINWHG